MMKNKIVNFHNATIEIFESSIDNISKLIFDIDRTQSNNFLLGMASILLSIASAYTTYNGFLQYIENGYIVALITFGIQSLLLVSSWQLGAVWASRDVPISLVLIFLSSFLVSVFFSYTDLFKTIYKDNYQQRDLVSNISNKRLEVDRIINDYLYNKKEKLSTSIIKETNNISNEVNKRFSKGENILKESLNKAKSKLDEASGFENIEIKIGGTLDKKTGVKSAPGEGIVSREFQREEISIIANSITPIENRLKSTRHNIRNFNAKIDELVSSIDDESKSISKLMSQVLTQCTTFITTNTSEVCSYSESAQTSSLQLIKINSYFSKESSFEEIKGYQKLRSAIIKQIHVAPITPEISSKMLNFIGKGAAEDSGDIHIFESSFQEIFKLNILAIGALFIAFSIDILIFMCGILGARQHSFLDAHKSSDLRQMKEKAIENILSIDLNESPGDSVFVKNMKNIIRLSNFNPQYIEHGFAASIDNDVIDKNILSKEVGLLTSLELMTVIDENTMGIHTLLFLWMSDKLNKNTGHRDFSKKLQALVQRMVSYPNN